MLSDICETFRTANIYFQIKKNACFYIFGLVVTLVILLASKRENSSQYTITILMLHVPLESNY